MFYISLLIALCVLVDCNATCVPTYNNVTNLAPNPDPISPDLWSVSFSIADSDPIIIEVNRAWSPLGADRFYQLVNDGYYNCAAFFRVVPDFVVQFGIAADPAETAKWNTNIPDDPGSGHSNVAWTVTFATAGPDTRTSQIFINTIDNAGLDSQGFTPFGTVTSGQNAVLNIYNPTPDSSNGCSQTLYTKLGNDWILDKYPEITIISAESIVN
jgi:peptidyl-prolyl cis-trans isomerase A (cyclophilin A)